MELKNFQIEASEQIANRYCKYMQAPLMIRKDEVVPFYQNLSAITGAGKTLILADTIEQIRVMANTQPIVLWLSKGKVVVGQTLENLANGKYAENITEYVVKPLLDCKEQDILDDEKGIILVATVGKFNQKDKENGDRRIFKTGFDNANQSLWGLLKQRRNFNNIKRELIIVYDEGHNLSDQQLGLLLDLKPDTLIAASATTKVPKKLENYINRLKNDNDMEDKDLIVAISNKRVVDSGLIKKHISIGGYMTPMEIAISNMLIDMKDTEQACEKYGCDFRPKAIYVSNTNALLQTSQLDDILVPFTERKARPIQIWRYLTEQGVKPEEIAVYCNLKFDNKFPKPNNFNLFNGGEDDYDEFINGDYKHIIFNQSLQEGWDDPSCYFAYIDKDMGSNTQVTQIIGRVLRQPNGQHYPDEKLNMASFYIKTDEKDVFKTIIEDVKNTLTIEIPEIAISYKSTDGNKKIRATIEPKLEIDIPDVAIDSEKAEKEIAHLIEIMNDYSVDEINTVGKGTTIKAVAEIGKNKKIKEVEVQTGHSNRVSVRWLFRRELNKLAKGAVGLCDLSIPKFDALIEYSSNATSYVREYAKKIAEVYRKKSNILQNPLDTSAVGEVFISGTGYDFVNSLHSRYSDFNEFELRFARELDKTGLLWMRNPQNGFLKIPLLDGKGTNNFNPDFVVWGENVIFALDTKGNHLIQADSERKLFFVEKVCDGPDLQIRLISEKKYNDKGEVVDNDGYTVWMIHQGKICPIYCATLTETIEVCTRR
ncbi:type III restriction enzyme [Mobilisporobacter senegalensis]|uniref:Type III restriction enzyme n=1 Tax=Mobilisporobacter senegalensis TaxID=1329262 RepID=A0A3N1XPF9_9FIRM|nr:DEAD/DEAH box helicase family protein [Mobilisporobacter senegalensis]ROR28506.1 type III restriction enzyme [Mobilisporobacter senegalensis]